MLQALIFEEIEKRRKERGLSKAYVTHKADISYSQYYNISKGRNTTLDVIEKLLKVVGITHLDIIL